MSEKQAIALHADQTYTFGGISFRLKYDEYGTTILYSDDSRVQFGSVKERVRYHPEESSSAVIIQLVGGAK